MSAANIPSRRETSLLVALFCAALVIQFYCTTLNWTAGFMPRHEFRQAQTAIITYYINEQNNFSPLYETPVVGKPWVSILLEVPVYQWTVVLVSRATGWTQVVAARTVSLACLYLTLPALYLLLGRMGLTPARRLLPLALLLLCPVYVFYSRAFLMDAMEVMCCAWFLLAFVRTMDERTGGWLALAIVAGLAASLIKSVTLVAWLLPAMAYGAWRLWRDVRQPRGWKKAAITCGWGLATILPGLLALKWWITVTDALKVKHASAWLFTAKNQAAGNWGLLNFGVRFSREMWSVFLERWGETAMPPWVIGVIFLLGVIFLRRGRAAMLGLFAVYLLAQLLFPFAYGYQDYYYYSCGVFLVGALGLVFVGLLDRPVLRWLCWPLVVATGYAEVWTYWHGYHVDQILRSNGGFAYTEALKLVTPRDSVIVVAGADWAAMIPLYSQRKALMIRNGLEFDPAYLRRAFDDLAGEDVSALVLVGASRTNGPLLNLAAGRFDLDRTTPTFSQPDTDIYVSKRYVERVQKRLRTSERYLGLTVGAKPPEAAPANAPFDISPEQARASFRNVFPAPYHGRFEHGVGYFTVDDKIVLSEHPDSDLSLHPPAGATQIRWVYGIVAEAYQRAGDKTDGVEFIVTGEQPDGRKRQIYRRLLDPLKNVADRGDQDVTIPYHAMPGESLVFSTRPNTGYSCDWAYCVRIEVK